jgi:ADP-ribosylglycohydrolase
MLRSKFVGCLVGSAVGDALGSSFEGSWTFSARALSLYLLGKHSFLEMNNYGKEKNGGCRSGEDRVGNS